MIGPPLPSCKSNFSAPMGARDARQRTTNVLTRHAPGAFATRAKPPARCNEILCRGRPTQEQIARLTLREQPRPEVVLMPALLPVTVWTIAASLLTGLLLALLGNMKLAMARRPERVTAPLALLLMLTNAALLPLLLGSGALVDKWGPHPMMIVGPV